MHNTGELQERMEQQLLCATHRSSPTSTRLASVR